MAKAGQGLVWLVVAALLLSGCGASGTETGRLEVRVWDHRQAIDDFSELWLTFSAVAIHRAGQPRTSGWIELEPAVQKLDLTRYAGGQNELLAEATVETGTYNAVRVTLAQVSGTLANGQQVDVQANLDPVALNFRIRSHQTTVLGLDLAVLDLSEHPGRGYELQLREGVLLQEGSNH